MIEICAITSVRAKSGEKLNGTCVPHDTTGSRAQKASVSLPRPGFLGLCNTTAGVRWMRRCMYDQWDRNGRAFGLIPRKLSQHDYRSRWPKGKDQSEGPAGGQVVWSGTPTPTAPLAWRPPAHVASGHARGRGFRHGRRADVAPAVILPGDHTTALSGLGCACFGACGRCPLPPAARLRALLFADGSELLLFSSC